MVLGAWVGIVTGRDIHDGRVTARRGRVVGLSTTGRGSRAGRAAATTARRVRVRRRGLALAAIDAAAWCLALVAAGWLRSDLDPTRVHWGGLAVFLPAAMVAALVIGLLTFLYGGRFVIGSADEAQTLGLTDTLATLILFTLNIVLGRPVPASVPVAAGLIAFLLSAGARFVWRRRRELRCRPDSQHATRLLVLGAGEAGSSIVKQLLHDPESPYLPVGLLDDDPMKRHLRVVGVPVLGRRSDLMDVAAKVDAQALLVAIPAASTRLVREVSALAEQARLPVRVLPSTTELLDGRVSVADIRPLAERELLGRAPVRVDTATVAACVRGRTVLVTGAGGSIGSELCRQLAQLGPAKLILLDRDESALHGTQLSIAGHALFEGDDVVVADVRDAERIDSIFATFRPDVVFHAAALKHLALLELHPGEALKTNVTGTENVVRAALAHGVETFVNISTDKAADPVCVLGFTKRITERLTAWAAQTSDGRFVSVRFGNVLGSRGSLLTTFQTQIAEHRPVTVTHPEVTRYFMTVEEAVQLVLQASVIGRPGEVLVLDMGEPVSIRRLAERLVAESPGSPEIVFTGLRRGEKLHEVLFATGERDDRPFHPAIGHVQTPPLDPRFFTRLDSLSERDLVVALAALSQQPDAGTDRSFTEPAFLVVDSHGLITSASVAARRLLSTRHEHLVGHSPLEFAAFVQGSDGARLDCHPLGEAVDAGERTLDERVIGIRRGVDSVLWLAVSVRPVLIEDGTTNLLVALRPVSVPTRGPKRNGATALTPDEMVRG